LGTMPFFEWDFRFPPGSAIIITSLNMRLLYSSARDHALDN